MMTKFEDRLFDDLIRAHGAELSAPTAARRNRAVWLSGGVVAAAGASAAGLVMFGSGATPAFAVTQNSDGTATIAVHQLSGIAGANAKLHSLGDNVVIVPVQAGCPSLGSLPKAGQITGKTTSTGMRSASGQITVNVTGIPAGDIAVVGVSQNGTMTQMGVAITTAPAPSCVSLPAPPPAGGGGGVVSQPSGPSTNSSSGSSAGPVTQSGG